MNDYYLNLLHWGQNNIIAVALTKSVYLYHPSNGQIKQLTIMHQEDNFVTSVQFSNKNENTIAIGTNFNMIELWDVEYNTKIRELRGHTARVSSLTWNNSNGLLTSGFFLILLKCLLLLFI